MENIKDKIAKYYKKGYYTQLHLKGLVRAGVIDEKTMAEIIKGV